MQVPLQITMRNLDHSEAVDERIRTKAEKLNQFSDHIISCEIVVEQSQAHRQNGTLYNIRINLLMPRKKQLVVTNNEQENLYLAIREAFDDMSRQVEDAARKMKGDVKHHPPRLHGKIARLFDDGEFGFIESHNGDEYYFNSDCLHNHTFDYLKIGMPVQFIEKMGDDGMRACRVSVRKEALREAAASLE